MNVEMASWELVKDTQIRENLRKFERAYQSQDLEQICDYLFEEFLPLMNTSKVRAFAKSHQGQLPNFCQGVVDENTSRALPLMVSVFLVQLEQDSRLQALYLGQVRSTLENGIVLLKPNRYENLIDTIEMVSEWLIDENYKLVGQSLTAAWLTEKGLEFTAADITTPTVQVTTKWQAWNEDAMKVLNTVSALYLSYLRLLEHEAKERLIKAVEDKTRLQIEQQVREEKAQTGEGDVRQKVADTIHEGSQRLPLPKPRGRVQKGLYDMVKVLSKVAGVVLKPLKWLSRKVKRKPVQTEQPKTNKTEHQPVQVEQDNATQQKDSKHGNQS